ncbi:hypothetical protein CHS0354_007957 [Potamilus streckersoni]|uniref:Avidin n=1 Tax=Potamilus streckersoni TaxID=2493646 RepID=A0AAE0S8S0_9BIVA|nr:hypothetical protein CHS0354_007957 [Potamilus streckersoni]
MIRCGVQIFIILILKYITAIGNLSQNERDSRDTCGITGTWKNELGSVIELSCANGNLLGKYRSAVGEAKDFYQLTGRYTMTGDKQMDVIFGFSVAWNNAISGNSNSTTSWTGIHYKSEDVIYTHWILTRYMERSRMWASNLVGHADFRRI